MTVRNFYQIIANADDFGRHELINKAVEEAYAKGCLRSATVMPGGVAFAGKIKLEEVRRELTAQMDKVLATGVTLSHIDSHQHMHTMPGIIDIALELAEKANISAVRIPQTPMFTGFNGNPVQLGGRMGLYTMATLSRRKAKAQGFRCPQHFAGIVAGEAVNTKHLMDIIQNLKPGTTEIMVHPGTDNKILQDFCQWDHDFEAELAALTSPEILAVLAKKQVKIGNYTNL